MSSNFIWNVPLSKLYTISLMSSLNARSDRSFSGDTSDVNRGGMIGAKSRVQNALSRFPHLLHISPSYAAGCCDPSYDGQARGKSLVDYIHISIINKRHGHRCSSLSSRMRWLTWKITRVPTIWSRTGNQRRI